MEHLSKQQESLCDNGGLVGVLIGLSCFVQHLIFMIPNWITLTVILVHLFSIVSFFLLIRRSDKAPLLLLIAGILVFLLEAFMIIDGAYSLVLLIYLIYLIVMIALIYSSPLPKKLKLRAESINEEKNEWQGKI